MIGRRNKIRMALAIIALLCIVPADWCNVFGGDTTDAPEQTIEWSSGGSGWKLRSQNGDSVFCISVSPSALYVWRWTDGTMKAIDKVPLAEEMLSFAPLRDEKWLAPCYYEKGDCVDFCLGCIKSGRVLDRWAQPAGWSVELGRTCRDGTHVAVWSTPNTEKPGTLESVRFGLFAVTEKKYDWITDLMAPSGSKCVNSLVPSNDGRYMGVAGWDWGVAMIDVTKKKVTWIASPMYKPEMRDSPYTEGGSWTKVPLDEIDTHVLAFAPDNRRVYAGGDSPTVFGFDVETGTIVSCWEVPSSLDDCGSITAISVSRDGKYVAAGTGPEGHVYLFSAKDGKRRVLNHGGHTNVHITSFSPDSKRLASFAAGQIKIWKLPEEEASPKTDKVTETKEAAK